MASQFNEPSKRYQDPEYDPVTVLDPDTQQAITASMMLPSKSVEPTRVDTPRQQASTEPNDGSRVHFGERNLQENRNQTTAERQEQGVPFKEQVIGYAQKTRGTLLGKPELKEHGQQILEGQLTHEEDRLKRH
ncbi:hypothetical protein CVT24_002679 [Panaeolus cyanescens]|uniref:Uncharacterized protein n=1 Tax=Panaeolus cyanescens TaxID=181874 RepID=A0A409WBC5_9AGAR|nr:hypothetical protein CVT24_002679 [Panaeolus cyanescens]